MRKIIIAMFAVALILGAAGLAEGVVQVPIVSMSAAPVGDGSVTPAPAQTKKPIVEVTPTPTPRPILAPTDTPVPENTPAPTNTSVPADTLVPTDTLEPAVSVEPTEEPILEMGTLMADSQSTTLSVGGLFSGGSTVLGSELPRTSVTSVRFEASLTGAPAEAWDVSAEHNGSVLAWMEDGALTIAGEGGVLANADSSYLFSGYSAVKSIDFNGCFITAGATNMAYMFSTCMEMTALNLSGFDTSGVENMEGMFFMDMKLEELDLTGFNTGSVTSMRSMFESCTSLKSLDLTSFNTSAAADMRWMFGGCLALDQISVNGSFAGNKNTSEIFSDCPASLTVEGSAVNTEELADAEKYVSLKLWAKGENVRLLQERLRELGYASGFADGVLGPNTQSALKAWQGDHGYERSGVLDAQQARQLMK